jgi:hypothetical protein
MQWMCTREEHQELVSENDSKAEGVLELIYVAQFHHPPLMGMYSMYHSLMIILIKDLDIFEVLSKIKEFKSLDKRTLL